MNQNDNIVAKEGKKIDILPDDLRKHYEDSMEHNKELMKRLASL